MTKEEELLTLYNQIDAELRKRYHENDRSISVMVRFCHELERSNIEEYVGAAQKLNQIRVLRNTVIHELSMNAYNLIEISDETIDFLKWLLQRIRNPKSAKDMCTPLNKLVYLEDNDHLPIKDLIKVMKNKGYSHIPVLDKENKLVGVFSSMSLLSYFSDHNDKSVENLKFSDIKKYTNSSFDFSQYYAFVSEDLPEDEVDAVFINYYKNGKKLYIAFVTKNGKRDEPIKGVIVLSDIIKA